MARKSMMNKMFNKALSSKGKKTPHGKTGGMY
jgi:hypothetical protein